MALFNWLIGIGSVVLTGFGICIPMGQLHYLSHMETLKKKYLRSWYLRYVD